MKLKERRKYRDNTEELINCQALFGAVIKQAFDDVRNFAVNKARGWDNTDPTQEEEQAYKDSRDACDFFKTKRLERFLTSHTLPIDATYLRRKYRELKDA